jgi:hypothetical protein
MSAQTYDFDLILPFRFLENVLKEQKLESVKEELLGESAK